jgi:hypothetical protein
LIASVKHKAWFYVPLWNSLEGKAWRGLKVETNEDKDDEGEDVNCQM